MLSQAAVPGLHKLLTVTLNVTAFTPSLCTSPLFSKEVFIHPPVFRDTSAG